MRVETISRVGGSARRAAGAALALAVALSLGAGASDPATAGDLDSLRRRAQEVADGVTGLERDLAGLTARRERLGAAIDRADKRIALLELQIHRTDGAYRRAQESYIDRAVDVYKAGSITRLALILSAQDINQLFDIEKATSISTDRAAEALAGLLEARARAQGAQDELANRKSRLMAAEAQVAAVTSQIEETISARRDTLRTLGVEIRALEAEARRQAIALAAARAEARAET
ncbi:MAG: hypothetical protein M3345_04105, partial [Actinomycetota bacterium]|nr:hypothetical protein [Actinomycetota bacterium]